MKHTELNLIVDEKANQHSWILQVAACVILLGLCGCASTDGGSEPAPMTNEYGDPVDSPAAQQMEMEDKMEAVTNSLIR